MGAAESSSSSGYDNWSGSSTYYNDLTPNQPPNVDYGTNNYLDTQFGNYQPYNNSTSPYVGGTFNYCPGCEDYKSGNLIYHPNGSRLCQDCISRTLVDTKKLQGIISKVQKFYKQHDLEFRTDYPILLVDENEIRRLCPTGSVPEGGLVTGMTVFDPSEVVRITNYVQNGENIEVVKEKTKVQRAILLFYNRSEAKIGGTLAHEMMHAYLKSRKGRKFIEKNIEEGVCEAISHMWFENEAKNNHESYYHKQLVEGIHRPGSIYRNEFEEAKLAFHTYGLRHTLKTLVKKGKLPKKAKIGGTLAHEMMHAYLGSIKGCKSLEENTEESLCAAISHMWFENEAKNNHESYYHNQLVKAKSIEAPNVYGNGFKEAKLAIDTFGLHHTLKTLVKKGKFPK